VLACLSQTSCRSPVPCAEKLYRAQRHTCRLRVLTIWQKIRKFRLKVKWNSNFPENPFGKCGLHSLLSPFVTERRKFPYHLVHFSVSSLSSVEWKQLRGLVGEMVGAVTFGWFADLEKPLPLFHGHSKRFILTNGKHPTFLDNLLTLRTLAIPAEIPEFSRRR